MKIIKTLIDILYDMNGYVQKSTILCYLNPSLIQSLLKVEIMEAFYMEQGERKVNYFVKNDGELSMYGPFNQKEIKEYFGDPFCDHVLCQEYQVVLTSSKHKKLCLTQRFRRLPWDPELKEEYKKELIKRRLKRNKNRLLLVNKNDIDIEKFEHLYEESEKGRIKYYDMYTLISEKE